MLRAIVGITCAAIALSAMIMSPLALFAASEPVLPLGGFEIIVFVAGILGVIWSRGKFLDAPSLALVCIAATVAVGTFLGYLSALGKIDLGAHGTVSLRLWRYGRLGAALLLVATAAGLSLSRDRRSIPVFVKGVIAAIPIVAAAGIYLVAGRSVGSAIDHLPAFVRIAIYTIAAIVLGGCLCASGHFLIRSFEIATAETEEAKGLRV